MTRGQRSALLWALLMLGVGGWLLHTRIHPPRLGPALLVPQIAGLTDIVLVTLLFLSRRTARAAYLLNGLLAIYGITIMTHFSLSLRPAGIGMGPSILSSTLADCAILVGDFLVGKALFDGYFAEQRTRGRWWNFLEPGWWLIHFILIPTVYTLGHVLWK